MTLRSGAAVPGAARVPVRRPLMRRPEAGFSMLELMIAVAVAVILVAVTYTTWQKYVHQQRLRYAAIQVASGLREAEERAKAERAQYSVAFTSNSPTYIIQRTSGGFIENAVLPSGVAAQGSDTVTFSPFGVPDGAHTITLQNDTGTRTASVDTMGGITSQNP
jgi:prepilin-type N-terminal cleavage/methylation domain-containing protein